MAKDANTIAARYARGFRNAAPSYEEGVQSPKRDWANASVAAQPRMIQAFQQAMTDGTHTRGVQNRGTQGWKDATIAKKARYAQSAEQAIERYSQVAQKVADAAAAGSSAAAQIDNSTWAGRVDRMRANAEAIASKWGKKLS